MKTPNPELIFLLSSLWFFLCGCLMCALGSGIEEE